MVKVEFKNGYTTVIGSLSTVTQRLRQCSDTGVHQEALDKINSNIKTNLETDSYTITFM